MVSKNNELNISNILEVYKKIPITQKNKSELYEIYQNFCINYLKQNYNKKIRIFNKQIIFPYLKFGNTDIFDLLGTDELLIFLFYNKNKTKYRKVLDIGANVGLHSIILSKLGYNVTAFEPDKKHFNILKKNLKLNKIKKIKIYNQAITDKLGKLKFTRVLGNTTGNHITNLKKKVYGKKVSLNVESINFNSIAKNYDLIKIDCEGSEKKIFNKINLNLLKNTDFILEITDNMSRKIVWKKFKQSRFKLFSQKNEWKVCKKISDLPCSHSEGSTFISIKNKFKI